MKIKSLPTYSCYSHRACVHACSITQSCLTLCNPLDCSLPGSSVYGIFQARTLKQVAISYSRGSSGSRDQTRVSRVSCTGSGVLYHCATGASKEDESPSGWSNSRTLTGPASVGGAFIGPEATRTWSHGLTLRRVDMTGLDHLHYKS